MNQTRFPTHFGTDNLDLTYHEKAMVLRRHIYFQFRRSPAGHTIGKQVITRSLREDVTVQGHTGMQMTGPRCIRLVGPDSVYIIDHRQQCDPKASVGHQSLKLSGTT